MREQRVRFDSGEVNLEGIVGFPDSGGPFPAVVVCHPHPLYGGDMYNNVVGTVCAALVQSSLVAFRFNFRGVGNSRGEFGGGVGEQDDVRAAIAYLSTLDIVDPGRIGFAGYSAGAGFGIPVACSDDRVKAVAAVSPPLSMFDFDALLKCDKPGLLVSGDRDDFTPVERSGEFCQGVSGPVEFVVIEGADHFWWGRETEVADRVTAFFARSL